MYMDRKLRLRTKKKTFFKVKNIWIKSESKFESKFSVCLKRKNIFLIFPVK